MQTAVASLGLFWLLGWSALGGVAFLGAAIATTKWLVARIKYHQRRIEKCRDVSHSKYLTNPPNELDVFALSHHTSRIIDLITLH